MPELLQIVPAETEQNLGAHRISSLPVLVLNVHTRCNCRCVMCDIWKETTSREIDVNDLRRHLETIRSLKVRWVVLTGGEPLLHSHLEQLLVSLREEKVRVTLLTTGLLLKRHAELVTNYVDDVILSLDGPREIHDQVRRVVNAFSTVKEGIRSLRAIRPNIEIGGRTTVQKANHTFLCATVEAARDLGLNWISFLAADLTSTAFNREVPWEQDRQQQVGLSRDETARLQAEIELLIRDCGEAIETGFIRESAEKLRRIVKHFRATLGLEAPVAPICNAPWVSAVLESDGTVRPCFFHHAIGHLDRQTLADVINGDEALRFRSQLEIASNPICRNCVCSLNLPSNNF